MRKIFASYDVALVSFYKTILDDNGIKSLVKNYYLTSGIGDLPANECMPTLYVFDEKQVELALDLLKTNNLGPWQCSCGEKITGQFAQCWKCGKMWEN